MAAKRGTDAVVEQGSLAGRVGARLRARRGELGATLKQVAGAADVSVSYLSAVEKGASLPSLPVLARIVHALELAISDVLRDENQAPVRREHVEPARPGVHAVSHEDLQLEIVQLVAAPGEAGSTPVALAGRDVFVYLGDGSLALTVDGERYQLEAGDSLDAVEPASLAWETAAAGAVSTWAAGTPRQR